MKIICALDDSTINLSETNNVVETSLEIAHSLDLINFVNFKRMYNFVVHYLVCDAVVHFDPGLLPLRRLLESRVWTSFTLIGCPLFLMRTLFVVSLLFLKLFFFV